MIARLIADDIKEWLPWIWGRLIERAVGKLPEDQQQRYAEEWSAFINETPGDLSKIFTAFGFGFAADSIARLSPGALIFVLQRTRTAARRAIDTTVCVVLIALYAPMFLLIALAIKIDSPGPVIFRQEFRAGNGKAVTLLTFRTTHAATTEERNYRFYNSKGIHNSGDARVTRIGRLLRRLDLDRALWSINTVRGEVLITTPSSRPRTTPRHTRREP